MLLVKLVITGVQTACARLEDINVAQESYPRNIEIGYFNNGTRLRLCAGARKAVAGAWGISAKDKFSSEQ